MTELDSPKDRKPDDGQGFPLELKLLLLVIAFGLLGIILKASGVL